MVGPERCKLSADYAARFPCKLECRCCQAKERHDIAQRAADAAIKSYLSNIGGTTEAVAKGIVDSLHLQAALQPKMAEYGLQEPWQALYRFRTPHCCNLYPES